MPTKKLPMQDGNSCAAHCTVIAIADMLNVEYLLSKEYAEAMLWPAIKFKGGEGPMTDRLAKADNSDPRRILAETETRWGGAVTARLMCDETEKARALTYVDAGTGIGLGALFNMLKGTSPAAEVRPQCGVYYNCSYLMLRGATAIGATYTGMHNILVCNEKGIVFTYNPNEDIPAWNRAATGWKVLDGQNKGAISYVFTGVCVALQRK